MIKIATLDWASLNHQLDYNRGHKSFTGNSFTTFSPKTQLSWSTDHHREKSTAPIARSTLPGYLNPPRQKSLYLMSNFRSVGKSLLAAAINAAVDEDQFYVVFCYFRLSGGSPLLPPFNFFFYFSSGPQEKSNLDVHTSSNRSRGGGDGGVKWCNKYYISSGS